MSSDSSEDDDDDDDDDDFDDEAKDEDSKKHDVDQVKAGQSMSPVSLVFHTIVT